MQCRARGSRVEKAGLTSHICNENARVETGAQWGILVAGLQTREDRATTGVVDSPLTRLVLVRRAVISGGVARAGRRPR